MIYKQDSSTISLEYNIQTISSINIDDDDTNETPKQDIQSIVTEEFDRYKNMDDVGKYKSLQYVEKQIIDNEDIEFDPNPFSLQSLQVLISNTPLSIMNTKIILRIANYICHKYPDDINKLEDSGIMDFIIKITFEPNESLLDYTIYTLDGDEEALDIIKEISKYELLIICLHFFKKTIPLLAPEKQQFFVSNLDFLFYILSILAGINTDIQISREKQEIFEIYQTSVKEALSINSKLKEENIDIKKLVIREILTFIQIICNIDCQPVSHLFLHIFKNSEYVKKSGVPYLSNRIILFHIIQSYKIKIKIIQDYETKKDSQIQIAISSIILNLLRSDFKVFYEALSSCGFKDFLYFFITNKLPFPQDCIQIFQLIIINKFSSQSDNDFSIDSIYDILKIILDNDFKIKYQLCLAFANMSLINDITDFQLDRILNELKILPDFLDCLNASNNENSIAFLSSLRKLIDYKLKSEGIDEEFMDFLNEVRFDLDNIDINRENEVIANLIQSIINIIPSDEDN